MPVSCLIWHSSHLCRWRTSALNFVATDSGICCILFLMSMNSSVLCFFGDCTKTLQERVLETKAKKGKREKGGSQIRGVTLEGLG